MKTIKFQVDNSLWEKFFRLYPGQGERSAILRKIVRHIIIGAEEHTPLDEVVAKRIIEDEHEVRGYRIAGRYDTDKL